MPDTATQPRSMRADARRNRQRILEATRALLIEQGADVPLDQIASRAGVSIATFYRRFEDRAALLKTIVNEEAETTLADLEMIVAQVEAGMDRAGWEDAMRELVLSAQSRLAPVMVAMNSNLVDFVEVRARMHDAHHRLVTIAQRHGLVRADTTTEEVMTLLLHATQPLPHLTVIDSQRLTRRTISVILAGLHPDASALALPGKPFRPGHGR